MKKSFVIQTERCGIHPSYIVSWNIDAPVLECEVVEGAFEGYLNSTDCTHCAAESMDMTVQTFLDIFVEKFLPILRMQLPELEGMPTFHIDVPKPITYG